MLLNLVWDRASDSKTLERTPRAATRRQSTERVRCKTERKPRTGFLYKFERMLSAYTDLILKDLRN